MRIPVKAGPHVVAAAFPKKPSALLETERQPYQAHFNMDRHPRIQPAVYSISVNGPYDAKGPGDTPSRRRILVCTPAKRRRGRGCAKRILTTLVRRAYRRPVTDADLQAPLKFYRDARAEGGLRSGNRDGAARRAGQPRISLPRGAGSRRALRRSTAYRISDLELASRLSFFLWSSIPDDELLDAAIARKAARRRPCSSSRCGACWPTRARARWSTTSPSSGCTCAISSPPHPDMRALPGFRRQSAPGLPPGDRAVLREHHARRPQRARPAAGELHLPE